MISDFVVATEQASRGVRISPNDIEAAQGEKIMPHNRIREFAIAGAMLASLVSVGALRAQDSAAPNNTSAQASKSFIHDTGRSLDLSDPFQPGKIVPRWRSGALIQDLGPHGTSFTLYDPSGNDRDVDVKIPGADVEYVTDVDLDGAGNIFVAG
ncbi:MAG: hypothetical protein ABR991_02890 [Terracidiphilus sp.]|jgi:hypothetical protein